MELELIEKIDVLSNKIENTSIQFSFRIMCNSLFFFKQMMLKNNVKFEEIDLEMIFNQFKEMNKTKTNI